MTEAGTAPHVVGLVYIAAHMPDSGESEAADGKRFPSVVSSANVIRKSPDGFTFLDPSAFPAYFAADLPPGEASFEAHAQIEKAQADFSGVVTSPAWRQRPNWMLVAAADVSSIRTSNAGTPSAPPAAPVRSPTQAIQSASLTQKTSFK